MSARGCCEKKDFISLKAGLFSKQVPLTQLWFWENSLSQETSKGIIASSDCVFQKAHSFNCSVKMRKFCIAFIIKSHFHVLEDICVCTFFLLHSVRTVEHKCETISYNSNVINKPQPNQLDLVYFLFLKRENLLKKRWSIFYNKRQTKSWLFFYLLLIYMNTWESTKNPLKHFKNICGLYVFT